MGAVISYSLKRFVIARELGKRKNNNIITEKDIIMEYNTMRYSVFLYIMKTVTINAKQKGGTEFEHSRNVPAGESL